MTKKKQERHIPQHHAVFQQQCEGYLIVREPRFEYTNKLPTDRILDTNFNPNAMEIVQFTELILVQELHPDYMKNLIANFVAKKSGDRLWENPDIVRYENGTIAITGGRRVSSCLNGIGKSTRNTIKRAHWRQHMQNGITGHYMLREVEKLGFEGRERNG